MKRNCFIALFLVLCMMISLAGCTNPIRMVKNLFDDEDKAASNIIENDPSAQGDVQLRDTVLYYKDDKGFLIPVMRKIPWTEGIAKATLASLVDNPANRKDMESIGLIPVIPANTEIRGMDIDNGLCKVDFSSDFLNYATKAEEESLVKAVVYTLTEFVTIDRVQLMIDGKIQKKLPFGTEVGKPITRDNINYVSAVPSKDKVVVYYEGTTNGLETYFVPVTKAVDKKDSLGVNAIDALDALVEGPPEGSGLYTQIPKGTKVISVDMNNAVAYVNFNEEILKIKDSAETAESVIKSIALTLREQYKDVTAVKILANGKEVELGKVRKEEAVAVPTFANQY
ncbi:GerMN domain-containing protein [Thermotalea metallivorans]|uniref:Spore germination protein GerM n=1 Tax=Thermotalea metallivorans TaxID=520762 RepID=A0A140L7I7_9FIRM|nr:GerMN domain-containing protein [Thermotalea metallivorans]KXG76512.1 Spore germination protein GerM [Thermotalea metallivorans]